MSRVAWLVEAGEQGDPVPSRLERSLEFAEQDLETWIQERPDLVLDGTDWIARQLSFDDRSRLDLLGRTQDDEWVVVELKRGLLPRSVLAQALNYVLCIGTLNSVEFLRVLEANSFFRAQSESVQVGVRELLEAEDEGSRRLSIVVAGSGRSEGLDIAVQFLQEHGLDITIRVVTFDLFKTPSGDTLLVREVDEVVSTRPDESARDRRTVDAVLARAKDPGVREALSRFLELAKTLALPVKPWPRSFTITGRSQGNPTILYVRPQGDYVKIWLNAENAAHFLELTEDDFGQLAKDGELGVDDAMSFAEDFEEVVQHRRTSGPMQDGAGEEPFDQQGR